MIDNLDAIQSRANSVRVAHIGVDELGFRVQKLRHLAAVDLFDERIENADVMAALDEGINEV